VTLRRTPIDRLNEARKSSLPTIGRGKPLNSQGNEGDLTFRRTSEGLILYIKANHSWHGVKVGESFSSLENAINDIKSKVDVMRQFRLPSTYSVTGNFTLDASGGIKLDTGTGRFFFYYNGDTDDYMRIVVGANGATTLRTYDSDGAEGHLTLDPDGDVKVSGASIFLDGGEALYFDSTGLNSIYSQSTDYIRYTVGGDIMMSMSENGNSGNQVYFDNASVGFQQLEPTYNSTSTTVDFRHSNKQNLTFGTGNITNLNLHFPSMSGNFVLLVKQDGTGSRTITNYKVYDYTSNLASGSGAAVWAGGSAPTLTTDANHVDILSFYWDSDNEIAYGVATLDFQF
tara:strand:+ start:1303 stop:2328 length:1026 start_codon:yes stop_codon:yes gene_type:complete